MSHTILRTHSLDSLRQTRHPQGGQHCRQERRRGHTTGVAIVGIGYIDDFIHLGRHTLGAVDDGLQNTAILVIGFPLHAQSYQKDAGLHRIDAAVEDESHSRARFLERDVLAEFGACRDALDNRAHYRNGRHCRRGRRFH